jgi:hypothetical protein
MGFKVDFNPKAFASFPITRPNSQNTVSQRYLHRHTHIDIYIHPTHFFLPWSILLLFTLFYFLAHFNCITNVVQCDISIYSYNVYWFRGWLLFPYIHTVCTGLEVDFYLASTYEGKHKILCVPVTELFYL